MTQMQPSGNRCGRDPRHPRFSPLEPIRTGPGSLPRILSLAAEKAKEWFYHPDKCPALNLHPDRRTRSERREACQAVLETLLKHLDLASLQVGLPTPAQGFIDLDMKTIAAETGLGQRRCERVVAVLKETGFLMVAQPRRLNTEGVYVGLRAIRVLTEKFFDWLGLRSMLKKERERASQAIRRQTARLGKSLADLMKRWGKPAGNRPWIRKKSRPGTKPWVPSGNSGSAPRRPSDESTSNSASPSTGAPGRVCRGDDESAHRQLERIEKAVFYPIRPNF
jgi:hypothetical protein